METRIIIAGGRDFDDYELLKEKCLEVINKLDKDTIHIVSGMARGADTLGEKFAKEFDIPVYQFPANWGLLGKRAGFIRNAEMAEFAIKDHSNGMLIAFWDGQSKGTEHMINLANERRLDIHVYEYINRPRIQKPFIEF